MRCKTHGRSIQSCGRCLPRKVWPKGMKLCRCGTLIDKTWLKCGPCIEWETEDWLANGYATRQARHGLVTQVNT